MIQVEGNTVTTILHAVEATNKKIDEMQDDLKNLHHATDKYKDVVIGLAKRFDKYEEHRESKCYVRLAQIENDTKDVQNEVRNMAEKAGDYKKSWADLMTKTFQMDSTQIEMDSRFTQFANTVNTQLVEIKEIITKSAEMHRNNEKEISGIHKRLDSVEWVSDLGKQFKKTIIGLIIAMFIAAIGLYSVGSKMLLNKSDNITKQELIEILKHHDTTK